MQYNHFPVFGGVHTRRGTGEISNRVSIIQVSGTPHSSTWAGRRQLNINDPYHSLHAWRDAGKRRDKEGPF